jgi:GxxExxY protein
LNENELSKAILGAAIEVHRELGAGLLESVYEVALADELEALKLRVERQKLIPVAYKGKLLEAGFRADLLVEDLVIVEVKSVEKLLAIHEVQLHTYLRLTGKKLGLLLNFNCRAMREGMRRVVNKL